MKTFSSFAILLLSLFSMTAIALETTLRQPLVFSPQPYRSQIQPIQSGKWEFSALDVEGIPVSGILDLEIFPQCGGLIESLSQFDSKLAMPIDVSGQGDGTSKIAIYAWYKNDPWVVLALGKPEDTVMPAVFMEGKTGKTYAAQISLKEKSQWTVKNVVVKTSALPMKVDGETHYAETSPMAGHVAQNGNWDETLACYTGYKWADVYFAYKIARAFAVPTFFIDKNKKIAYADTQFTSGDLVEENNGPLVFSLQHIQKEASGSIAIFEK